MLKVVVGSVIVGASIIGAAGLSAHLSPYQTCVRAMVERDGASDPKTPADVAKTIDDIVRLEAQLKCARP